MGNFLQKLFDYPIKRQPICFHLPENYSSTGEYLGSRHQTQARYETIINAFFSQLLLMRHNNLEQTHTTTQQFPGWKTDTISHLHGLFVLHNNNGMLNFKDFCSILEGLCQVSSAVQRKKKYEENDAASDGFIHYDSFLKLMYKFDPPDENDQLQGLAKLCLERADNIQFIINFLSVGDQLQYGLF